MFKTEQNQREREIAYTSEAGAETQHARIRIIVLSKMLIQASFGNEQSNY